MPDALSTPSRRIGRLGVWWLIGCGVLLPLCFVLGWFDDATELTPDHSDIIGWGFALGGLAAIISRAVLWRATASWPTKNRVGFTLAGSFLTFLGMSMTLLPAGEIVEGWIDFPPSKTVTYQNVLVKISRAYQTHGKGRSWNVQTSPIWSNIDVTEADYDFMLDHRSADDRATDPDEVTSRGYFCALVTMQKAGDALRIMHAGRGKLPRGSILICPADFEQRTHL